MHIAKTKQKNLEKIQQLFSLIQCTFWIVIIYFFLRIHQNKFFVEEESRIIIYKNILWFRGHYKTVWDYLNLRDDSFGADVSGTASTFGFFSCSASFCNNKSSPSSLSTISSKDSSLSSSSNYKHEMNDVVSVAIFLLVFWMTDYN